MVLNSADTRPEFVEVTSVPRRRRSRVASLKLGLAGSLIRTASRDSGAHPLLKRAARGGLGLLARI